MKIAINKDSSDIAKSGRLKVELTIDGARELEETGMIDFEKQDSYFKFSPDWLTIFITVRIDWETPKDQVLEMFDIKDNVNIIEEWKSDPKAIFYFYPSKESPQLTKEGTAKVAATMWANHAPEAADVSAINISERHCAVATAYANVEEIKQAFQYDKYKQDDKYYELLKTLSTEMDKELDFMQAKMKLLGVITGNDFNKTERVNDLYREFIESTSVTIDSSETSLINTKNE